MTQKILIDIEKAFLFFMNDISTPKDVHSFMDYLRKLNEKERKVESFKKEAKEILQKTNQTYLLFQEFLETNTIDLEFLEGKILDVKNIYRKEKVMTHWLYYFSSKIQEAICVNHRMKLELEALNQK